MGRRKRCQREIEGVLSLRKAVSGMAGLSEEIAFEEEPAWQRQGQNVPETGGWGSRRWRGRCEGAESGPGP